MSFRSPEIFCVEPRAVGARTSMGTFKSPGNHIFNMLAQLEKRRYLRKSAHQAYRSIKIRFRANTQPRLPKKGRYREGYS